MIYETPNFITNKLDYIVPDQATKDQYSNTYGIGEIIIGDETLALQKLGQNQEYALSLYADTYNVAEVTTNSVGEVWTPVDIEVKDGAGDFRVFNTLTGQYEIANSALEAKQKLQDIKNAILNGMELGALRVVDVIKPILPPEATIVYSESVYGVTVGTIPVEIM